MREVLISLGTIGAALAIVAAAVFAGHDHALFVPPPEVVAEEFARKLGTGRYDLARSRLSRTARERETAAVLAARFEPLKSRIGAINGVEAREQSRDAVAASAVSELTGKHGAVTLTFWLTREQGLWVIDRWEVAEIAR